MQNERNKNTPTCNNNSKSHRQMVHKNARKLSLSVIPSREATIMEPRQRRLRVIRRLLCLFLFLFLAASSIRKFRYSVKEARHFAAESLIHLAKDLDEEILDVSRFNTNVYNSAQRRSEEDFKEEPEVYERPSSPMPRADPSAPPQPPVAPRMPPPDV